MGSYLASGIQWAVTGGSGLFNSMRAWGDQLDAGIPDAGAGGLGGGEEGFGGLGLQPPRPPVTHSQAHRGGKQAHHTHPKAGAAG